MIAVADIPLKKAVAGVRVGLLPELGFVVNPTVQQMEESKLDLIMAGTESAVLMIEGYCDFLTEDQMLEVFSILGLLPCAWLKECVLLLRLCCWCCCYLLKAFNHSAVCQPSFLDCPEGRGGEGGMQGQADILCHDPALLSVCFSVLKQTFHYIVDMLVSVHFTACSPMLLYMACKTPTADWPTGQMLLHLNLQVRAANVSVS